MQEVITDNLELWTSALLTKSIAGRGSNGKLEAYGIKKLRELILELAVRGKLVPQDASDEPASVLLEKIAKEKARLIREGLIKKEKSLPEIGDDEKSFLLPSSWEWRRLQDVSSYVQRGKGPKYADFGKVRVVSQKCIQWSGFDLTQARYVDDASLDGYQPERFLRKDDILWNSTGTGTAGRINVIPEVDPNSLVADSHVTIVRPLMVSSRFLSCYISAPGIQQRIEPEHESSLVSGTTNQVELNLSAVVQLAVPIPPFAEQHRIVAKVDELMALCDQLEHHQTDSIKAHQTLVASLLGTLTRVESQQEFSAAWARIASHFDTLFATEASIDQLKQTILQLAVIGKLLPQDPNDEPAERLTQEMGRMKEEMLANRKVKYREISENPDIAAMKYVIPDQWSWMRFGDAVFFQEGPGIRNWQFTSEGIKLLNVSNILADGRLDFENSDKYVSLDEFEQKYTHFQIVEGDLLFAGSGASWGKVAWFSDPGYPVMLNTSTMRLCFFHSAFAPNYLLLFTRCNFFKDQVAHQLVGLQPNFGSTHLSRVYIPVPPINEQHRIVAKVDELMALCDTLKARLAEAQAIQLHLAETIVEQALC